MSRVSTRKSHCAGAWLARQRKPVPFTRRPEAPCGNPQREKHQHPPVMVDVKVRELRSQRTADFGAGWWGRARAAKADLMLMERMERMEGQTTVVEGTYTGPDMMAL